MLFKVNDIIFFYGENDGNIVSDYYEYIVNIIKKIIYNNSLLKFNILLSNDNYEFNNNNKTIKININYEHTLVKSGGRSVNEDTPYGLIKDENDLNYHVRIINFDLLNNSDIIIDYSIPNIINVKMSNIFNDFTQKHIYISCSIYENFYFTKENRNINVLTTFINKYEERRAKLIETIHSNDLQHININNCFNKEDLQNLYKNTKILINIHQTAHHDTFEELRVLPAIQCGVIVISEISPLYEFVPYHNFVIWCKYDNIVDKIKEVLNNYSYYYDEIYKIEKMDELYKLKNYNYDTLNNKILKNITI